MIRSFGDSATEDVFSERFTKATSKLPPDLRRSIQRKLQFLNAAVQLNDLRSPPGNRLEALKGDLKEYYSIRINDQWRIIFKWEENAPTLVKIVDYHK